MITILFIIIFILTILILKLYKKNNKETNSIPLNNNVKTAEKIPENSLPERIGIGEHENNPFISIEISKDAIGYQKSTPLPKTNGTISKLTSMLQAVPSILIAENAAGKQIMEVVINGDLIRASDGNGLRAFTMGAKGIKEHARLFEVNNLQNMINSAAMWQIASVLVAQKHLADISSKLEAILRGIQDISHFLTDQRRARIQSSYDYLRQVSLALLNGEFPASVRNEIEGIERDLLEIQHHLEQEFNRKLDEKSADGDTFGTKDITKNLINKADALKSISNDITLCLKTRIAAWHVLSLYPGEQQLKKSRILTILDSIKNIQELPPHISKNLVREANDIKSFWNKQTTLDERKQNIISSADSATDNFHQHISLCVESMKNSNKMLSLHDKPMKIFLDIENGNITQARLTG